MNSNLVTFDGLKVFLTGHTGFKGTWLSIWLQKLGASVVGYSNGVPTTPSIFEICGMEKRIENITGDVRDFNLLLDTIKHHKPDLIFHLAAQPIVRYSYKNPRETFDVNVLGTVNILEAARTVDSVKAVVIVTTDKCYENMNWVYGYRESDVLGGYDPYSASKSCAELIVASYRNSFYKNAGIALSTVRAGNVIGGGDWATDRLIPDFVRATAEGLFITVRNPLATRPWQFVLEPLYGYMQLALHMLPDSEKYSTAVNFGPFDESVISVGEIMNKAIRVWGTGGIQIDRGFQPHESSILKLDISKAKALLSWTPLLTIDKAIENTILWYKNYYEVKTSDMYAYTLKQIEDYEGLIKSTGVIND